VQAVLCNVFETSKFKDHQYNCVLQRLEVAYEVNRKTDQHVIDIVQPGHHIAITVRICHSSQSAAKHLETIR
jgi:hypothetical protein